MLVVGMVVVVVVLGHMVVRELGKSSCSDVSKLVVVVGLVELVVLVVLVVLEHLVHLGYLGLLVVLVVLLVLALLDLLVVPSFLAFQVGRELVVAVEEAVVEGVVVVVGVAHMVQRALKE